MFDKFTFYVQNRDCKEKNSLAYINNYSSEALRFRSRLKQEFPNQYFPKLSHSHCIGLPPSTKIEVSWPKLLYGNNLFEVGPSDFSICIKRLQEQLAKIDWQIEDCVLRQTYPVDVEIALTVNLYDFPIEEIFSYLYPMKSTHHTMKLKSREYDPGQQIIFRGKHREITFYNKRKELLTHQTEQHNLDWLWTNINAPKNLLRLEIRLKKKYLENLFDDKKPLLQDIFTEKMYQKIIQRNWCPFYTHNKDTLLGLSPVDEIELLGDKLPPEQRPDFLVIKTIINKYGFNETKYQLAKKYGWSEAEIKQKMDLLSKSKILSTVLGEYNFMPFLHNAIINHTVQNKMEQFLEKPTTIFAFEEYMVKDWWSSAESAKYLGVSDRQIRKMCETGNLKSYQIGKLYRLKKVDVIEYQMSCKKF